MPVPIPPEFSHLIPEQKPIDMQRIRASIMANIMPIECASDEAIRKAIRQLERLEGIPPRLDELDDSTKSSR